MNCIILVKKLNPESYWIYQENACNKLKAYLFNIIMKIIEHFVGGKSLVGLQKGQVSF